ncbi:hypothetical protein LRS10_20090 [Phenylobacterium sp. J426]|uniref:hypothetical protein n=1 Tax=Phenylobacterium sp. J426 TaxID=2898439 RepID=UPI002151D928|nr:hypothetical protein [Phenylobacterium sp. J426]MCR5876243.1 hypothetical protein [Phenylobacterium sp. J426]
MRALLIGLGLSSVIAAPSLACDFHGGGYYREYSGYENYATYEEMKAREAAMLAERERAMAEARQSFLARFDIKAEDAPQQFAAASVSPPAPVPTDADRSAQPDAQDR